MTRPASVTLTSEARGDHTGAAFLEALTHMTDGWTEEEIERTARAWLVTETEIKAWKKEEQAKTSEERLRLEAATAMLAAGAERAILNRGAVLTPAILEAEPEQLLAFIQFYEEECERLYREAAALAAKLDDPSESFEYLQVRHKFDRLAGFLWESRTQSGVWSVHHPEQRVAS